MARILAFLAVAAFRVASCATPPDAGAGWTTVVSKGAFGEYDAGAAAFASAMAQAPHKLIRRDCSSCSADTAKTVFYKRLTPLPAYDGHHLAIYLDDYPEAYRRMAAQDLVWNNPRFNDMPTDAEDALVKVSWTKALPLCCASTVFLSQAVPFRAVHLMQRRTGPSRPTTAGTTRWSRS